MQRRGFCDVWNGDDRAGDYAAVDALFNSGFGRGEVVVFKPTTRLLSAKKARPRNPNGRICWAGNGGWLAVHRRPPASQSQT